MLGVFTAEGVLTLHVSLTFSDTNFFFPYERVCVAYTHASLEKQANRTDFSNQKISSLQVPVHDSCSSCYMHHEHSIRERNNRITSLSSGQNSQGNRYKKMLSSQVYCTLQLLTVGLSNLNNFFSLSCFR